MPKVNKIVVGEDSIDLTQTTVVADKLYVGYTALDAKGELIVGTMEGGSGSGGEYNVKSNDNGDGTQTMVITDAGGSGGIDVVPLNVTANGSYTAPDGSAYSPVNVNVSGGGGIPPVDVGVNFIDYDGSVVAVWNTSEVASKSALPENPDHTQDTWYGQPCGLISQGWNWTLDDIKSYIAENPSACLTVGQMYNTDDGKTRLFVKLTDDCLSPRIHCVVEDTGSITVDWGDGTQTTQDGEDNGGQTTYFNEIDHTYQHAGNYIISMSVTERVADFFLSGTNNVCGFFRNVDSDKSLKYAACVECVQVGNVCALNTYACVRFVNMNRVSMPNRSAVLRTSGYEFNMCYSLRSLTIPYAVTSIPTYLVRGCMNLEHFSMGKAASMYSTYTFMESGLKRIAFAKKFTASYTCSFCFELKSAFMSNEFATIPNYTFNQCMSLEKFVIPSTVTSIGTYAFAYTRSLAEITIPEGVTSIGTYAFYYSGLREIHFKSSTPPTLASSYVFSGIPAGYKIYVPKGSLSAYQSATNYPTTTYATYVEE